MSESKQDQLEMETEENEDEIEEEEEVMEGDSKAYLPGNPLNENEELICDETAYLMYHQAQTGAPCLSFDILPDKLGEARETFPLSCYMVVGTQADSVHTNNVMVLKLSNMHKNKQKEKNEEESDSEDEESDEDEDEKPELEAASMKHTGGVNRIRATMMGDTHIAASWSETGRVYMWNLTRPLEAVNDANVMSAYTRDAESPAPVFNFSHQVEGFAMDWSPTQTGRLATGDCKKNIHIWNPAEGGSWNVDQRPYSSHTQSVEDIQWSPNEPNVFASCSVDKSIKIWDARAPPNKACMLTAEEAHDRDVNVISWNKTEPFILSGGDDGVIKVWDLRQFQTKDSTPVALFKHHTAPITSIEWHPTESSIFAASGSDNQITIWDLAVERDTEMQGESTQAEPDVPPQLLFIHQGQTDIKELHWHKQLPGVVISTALSGFNIFRTISV